MNTDIETRAMTTLTPQQVALFQTLIELLIVVSEGKDTAAAGVFTLSRDDLLTDGNEALGVALELGESLGMPGIKSHVEPVSQRPVLTLVKGGAE